MADATAIISAAQGFAADAAAQANAALLEVQNAINAAGFIDSFETNVDLDTMISNLSTTAEDVVADLAKASEFQKEIEPPENRPEIGSLVEVGDPDIDTGFGTAPAISLVGLFDTQVPVAFSEDPPVEPPGIDEVFPAIAEPTINQLNEPDIAEIDPLPTYEQINPFPIFDEKEPGAPPVPPEQIMERYEAAYNRMVPEMKAFVDGCVDGFLDKFDPNHQAHMDSMQARIDLYLQGGSGFNDVVEQAIYDRGRGRVQAESRAVEQAAWDQVAAKGHRMPSGMLQRELRRSAAEAANRDAGLAMDIVKLQGELEQKNLQFALQQAIALRTAIRSAAIQYSQALLQINRDALDFARQFVDAVIRVYDLEVNAWRTSVDYLRARITLFEARLRASLADVEIFKAKVEAVGQINELNKTKVETFKARIGLEEAKIELFAAKINAQQTEISRRQALISIYQAQVQAYSSKVQAKTAEFTAYTAALDGDKALVQAQISKVDAYRAKIDGISAANQAKVSVVTTQHQNNRAVVEKFRAEMDAWIREYDAEHFEFDGYVKAHDVNVQAYATMARNQVSQRGLLVDYNRAIVQANSAKVQAEAQAHLGTMQAKVGKAQATIGGATAAAETAAGIATGALSAQNTLVQVAEVTNS